MVGLFFSYFCPHHFMKTLLSVRLLILNKNSDLLLDQQDMVVLVDWLIPVFIHWASESQDWQWWMWYLKYLCTWTGQQEWMLM